MEHTTFLLAIDALIADYLSDACPCRFPRFRATTARDSTLIGPSCFVSAEQQRLVLRYEQGVPLVERCPTRAGSTARCGVCGGTVEIFAMEFEEGTKRRLVFPAPVLPDVGAPIDGALPRVLDFYPLERIGMPSAVSAAVAAAYPRMEPEAWLAWMRERAPSSAR